GKQANHLTVTNTNANQASNKNMRNEKNSPNGEPNAFGSLQQNDTRKRKHKKRENKPRPLRRRGTATVAQ
ncbi:Hypothetical predicted protein, partial [Pelobates cultripes]